MRVRKPEEKHHAFRATEHTCEILLVRGGRHSYLWVGEESAGSRVYTFTGQQGLRALARAILREVPARKTRNSGGNS